MRRKTVYTPAWADSRGNRILFVGPSTALDQSGLAYAKQMMDYPFYCKMGLKMDGIQKIEMAGGEYMLQHVLIDMGNLIGQCVAGPIFDEATQ